MSLVDALPYLRRLVHDSMKSLASYIKMRSLTFAIIWSLVSYCPKSRLRSMKLERPPFQALLFHLLGSPTTTATGITSQGGLASGDKAGIGVSVALVVIIALLVALFCFRERKKQSKQSAKHDPETADALASQRSHEMITSANTHEMDPKGAANVQVEDVKPDRPEGFQELETQNSLTVDSRIRTERAAEMDAPYTIQSTNVGSDWERLKPSELDASTSAAQRAELHSPLKDPGSTSIHPPVAPLPILNTSQREGSRSFEQESLSALAAASSSSPSDSEDKLEMLRKRMEIVREDKDRLEKIQALKELEEELQAEILAEQKKAAGI